jgi:glutamate---cysteine ligase / carboxylate-amine ligase
MLTMATEPDRRCRSTVAAIESPKRCPSPSQPAWARWNRERGHRYTVGIEEELMLLSSSPVALAECSESVLRGLSEELAVHAATETHAAAIELATGVHPDASSAVAELASLRGRLACELARMGLLAASSGTYPLNHSGEFRVSTSARYGAIGESMRGLARREPTFALHVHIGIPDPEDAVRLLNGLREAVPILIALSANSPFSQGRDSGFASMRTVIFQGFPRTGTARRFEDYGDYVETVDALIASGALADPTFLWWDVRLQPALGTVELRMMDAQTTIADSAALAVLVTSLARSVLEDDAGDTSAPGVGAEVLAENRFLAARDGLAAELIDPATRRLVPARAALDSLLRRCRDHADPVGLVELDRVARLAASCGADRQRAWARSIGPAGLVARLTQRFAPPGAAMHRRVTPALPGVDFR